MINAFNTIQSCINHEETGKISQITSKSKPFYR